MSTTSRTRRAGLAAAAALLVALTGCQGQAENAVKAVAAPAASLAVSIPDGATEVSPKRPVHVAVTGGSLKDVSVKAADGTEVPGELSQDDTLWTAKGQLAVQTGYTVTASAENGDGKATPITSGFTTVTPADSEEASIVPRSGETVGVAMPIIVRFDAEVLDRAEVERKLSVTSNPPQEGSWSWFNDKEIQYRTKEHWKPGTQVTVAADMTGVEFAGNVWGVNTEPSTFTVGRYQLITVDINGYQATVQDQAGQVIQTFPVSNGMGTGEYATRNGKKVIMTRQRSHVMVSPGKKEGDPGYYRTPVSYAMRVTNSGEFLHAAPWSVGAQGRRNVSHGCTNLSTSNARWIYENSLIGDPVDYVNGNREIQQGNGWAMWDISYEEWKKGSALNPGSGAPVEADVPKSPVG